jgi:hypothetical protein
MEPLLKMCQDKLGVYGLPVPGQYPLPLVTSAYADDIIVFLTKDEGLLHLLNIFMIYGAISEATLNMQKTKGLCVGAWRNRKDKPLGLKSSSEGGKFLGIYMGNTQTWQEQNWAELRTKYRLVCSSGTRLYHTSYQGQKITLNQMVGSKLNHVIKVLPPPEDFSSAIQHMFVNFIWNGRHWTHPHYVYAGMVDGGIGVNTSPRE